MSNYVNVEVRNMEVRNMENRELVIAQIVSSIITKPDVVIGADRDKGVAVHIKTVGELDPNQRSTITLKDLILQVEKSLVKY
jgi:hypothetical protein